MAGVPMRCVLKKPFMLSGCVGFPNKAFPPPDLCSPKRGAACPTEALHNRRGAGLRDRVRAAAYAVCRRRFAARRRGLAERKDVFAVCRGFRGFRKVVLRALTPARPVWRAPFPARSAADTGLRHTAGMAAFFPPSAAMRTGVQICRNEQLRVGDDPLLTVILLFNTYHTTFLQRLQ